ncbi:hypothetical protein ABID30_003644 [Enterococcus rotai]|uniref:Uncharacterized protein n=1 Tax=Enterococcus rotai TaxID=118060 RepID=A0A0U2LV86_9ENTE|nr:hypothetical protein [Enterococcus rotai]ALS36613.1 hypothetical protein ATZ35_05385 [Enterococcus rotai]
MRINWAKYLKETPEYEPIITNKEYIDAWNNYFENNKENFPLNELVLITGNMTIKNETMVLEYALLNQTKKPVKEIEFGVTLSLFGKEYFTGALRTNKNCYEELLPNDVRLDLIDFGNDRYDNQKLSNDNYQLIINYCNEISYDTDELSEKELQDSAK